MSGYNDTDAWGRDPLDADYGKPPTTGYDVFKPMVGSIIPVVDPSTVIFTTPPLTGWSTDYYKLHVARPTDPGRPAYDTECNDIIEALGLTFAEGNILKAVWRRAAARMGNGKQGTSALYDAEKIVFFGQRLVEQEKAKCSA